MRMFCFKLLCHFDQCFNDFSKIVDKVEVKRTINRAVVSSLAFGEIEALGPQNKKAKRAAFLLLY